MRIPARDPYPYAVPSGATALPPLPRDTPEWHAVRAQSVGASEIAMALGCSAHGGLLDLVLRKRLAAQGKAAQRDTDELAEGRVMEGAIIELAAMRLRRRMLIPGGCAIVASPAYHHPTCPDLTATPDGLIDANWPKDPDDIIATLETKRDRSGANWSEIERDGWRVLMPGDLRLAYWWQVQTQLAVTGCPVGYLAVHTAYETHLIQVDADPAAAEKIVATARAVMAWVRSGLNPAPTDADTLAAIAATVHTTAGDLPADDVTAAAIDAYVAASAAAKAADARLEEAKRRLAMTFAVTGAKRLVAPSGASALWVATKASERIDANALRAAEPEIAKRYTIVGEPGGYVKVSAAKAPRVAVDTAPTVD